jgi:hypothetical protein
MGLRLIAVSSGCLGSLFDAATGRFFKIASLGHEKKRGKLRFPAPEEE